MPEVHPPQRGWAHLARCVPKCLLVVGCVCATNPLLERALGEAAADAVGSEPPVVLWIIGGPGRTSGKGLTHRTQTVLILPVLGKPNDGRALAFSSLLPPSVLTTGKFSDV